MTIENEGLDEAALFDQAVSDEPLEATEKPEVVIEPEKVETEATLEAEPEKAAVDDNAPMIPSFRLKQEADARRQAETDLANERADKAALRQRLEALEKPAAKAEEPKAAKPDPLLDPEGYEKYLETKFEEKLLNNHRESSLELAHRTYKTEFEEAYTAAQKQIDPALKARMQTSRDPGETLIEWHREQKAKAEVGTDLAAYKQRLRDEALKDPEFRKAAMEAWRNEGQQQPQSNGRPRVELPPSLNGASRSNALLRPGNGDISDEQLFAEATG